MNILRLFGFYKVGVSIENSNCEVIDRASYWEWGVRLKIPFTYKQKPTPTEDKQ